MRRIRLLSMWIVAICGGVVLIFGVEPARGDEASAKAALAAKGIHASRSELRLQAETDFTKAVTLAYSLKRKLQAVVNKEHSSGTDNEEADAAVQQLMEQNEVLKRQLAQATPPAQPFIPFRNEVSQQLRSQISEQIRQNDNEMALIQQSRKQSATTSGESQKEADSARKTYLQQLTDARALADRLTAQYAELNKDKEVEAAVKDWNDAMHTSAKLKPTRSFESALKRLEALEKKIESAKVPLRRDGLNYVATVEINGKQTCDMIVDAGTATLLLPYQTAVDAGVNVDAATATMTIPGAAGSQSELKRVLLSSVRVGGITAKNVSCGVFPAKVKAARAALGMSFLSKFKYDIDAGASQLSLVRLDGESTTTHKRKKPTPKHMHKKVVTHAPSDEPQE